ncbi:polyketide synthase, putative [Cordyceps militaris CM01]|uniref:Polyketide synthase, putative n=1 Tax=Cordyceps militaris (strain CM01) TaxID=983644 RepID=G3J2Y2_CORMM|nr:polyketide synthase, putative [Cordyceps militaris CM01]EGX97261.1 polyketide synthase, putative [Cordyceps militaris CM01]
MIRRHSDGQIPYPTAQNSHILGLCTGALAAAAVSASSNLFNMVPHAVEAVIAALHCGLAASLIGKSLSGDCEYAESSWSLLLSGASPVTVQDLIDKFNGALPLALRVHIIAQVHDSVTVSGPPRSLSQLRLTDKFRTLAQVALPIRAPYHAAHLFGEEHVQEIMQHISQTSLLRLGFQPIPVVSCGSGQSDWSITLSAKLEAAVRDVLINPVVLNKAITRLAEFIQFTATSQVSIIPIGTSIGESVHGYLTQAEIGATVVLDVAAALTPSPSSPRLRGPMGRSKIAVVGMSGRFPGASDVNGLWDVLINKMDMCREVPGMRWNVETHFDPKGKEKNKSKVRYGCWIDNPDLFDARFFSISPREAPQIDPAQRMALLTAYEALESAGIVPGRTPSTREDRVGVFFGVTSNDWCEANSNQKIDTYFIPGANRAFIPGRINYCFKFSGPSYAVDTACSSSLSAIHIAFNSLLQGDIDMAIAGGTNVLTNPDMTCGLDRGHFLSSTGNCKTFDASADGYCRGEGVATVILKRLEDAIADNDPIMGIISGAYTNHSAEAESITRPHVGAQRDILNRVLSDSGTDPYDVGYVEMHGTGTQAGDLREMQSVCSVFAPNDRRHRRAANQPLHLGALKSNIGHGESVSGVSALIKVLLMMTKSTIPPHCGIKTQINPGFPKDLRERNVFIDLEAASWERSGGIPRKAIINNFSAAGGNSTILVEDASDLPTIESSEAAMSRPTFPVAVTARSAKSLVANLKAILQYTQSRQPDLAQLSYTTTARRMHHAHRILVVGSSLKEVQNKLNDALSQEIGIMKALEPKKILFTFTGQGSQYAGMGKRLYDGLSVFRHQLQHLDRLVRIQGFPSIISLFIADSSLCLSDFQPVVVQLASTCMQIALARMWISWGMKPTAVVGHSLGEYAALNIAGVLSDADTIYLVGRRAQCLQALCESGSHAMLAVIASESEIEATLQMPFEVSCVNGPKETVIAGTLAQVTRMRHILLDKGIRSTLLNTPFAFHTSQIDPIRAQLVADAHRVTFNTPKIPVLSSLLGTVVESDGVFNAEYIGRQARETVQVMQALHAGTDAGIIDDKTYGIEFGPHPVVAGMVKSTLGPAVKVLPTLRRNADAFEVMTETLSAFYNAGASINWDEYFCDIPYAQTVIPLPAYNWDLQSYWIEYKNDFCLYKGDLQPAKEPVDGTPSKAMVMGNVVPELESSTIHRIVSEEVSASTFTITTECDVGRKDLNHVMQGHKVDGIGLSTPSVYGDIGFSLGTYALKRFRSAFLGAIINVSHMDIDKALIGSAKHKQFLRCTAKFDLQKMQATCVFSTHDENGNRMHQHATCRIICVDDSNRARLQSQLPQTKVRFEEMRRNCANGKTFRFNNAMAYNMVSKLAEFDPDYQCVDETVYDNENFEAACTSGGFTMNANESTNLEKDVFVNHGWDGFELYETIREDCQYHTHVKMSPAENGQWKGDIVIFTGDRIVGFVQGVCLQGVPRRVLKYILSSSAGPPKATSGSPKSAHAPVPVQEKSQTALNPKSNILPTGSPGPSAVPAASRHADGGLAQKVIEVIAGQALVDPKTITDDTNFNDIGIDSLLMLMISGSLVEELGITIQPTFFVDNPTVGSVRTHFGNSSQSTCDVVPTPRPITLAPEPSPLAPVLAPVDQFAQQRATTTPKALTPVKHGPATSAGAVTKALSILSEETGVELASLTDQLELAEVGVDSLLLLIISSRFCEELGLYVQPDQLALECNTVSRIKRYVAERCGLSSVYEEAAPTPVVSTPAPGLSAAPVEIVPVLPQHAIQTRSTQSFNTLLPSSSTLQLARQPLLSQPDTLEEVLKIIAEETGVAISELTDTADFAGAGIDSLLALIISSRLRDELDMDLGPDSALLTMQTIGQLRVLVEGQSCSTIGSSTPDTVPSSCNSDLGRQPGTDVESACPDSELVNNPVPATTSVVLQNNPRVAHRKVLFFFPDGSGSATSYTQLPRISADLVVYGLNSPFLKSGDTMGTVAFDDLVQSYIAEIRRRQLQGPYSFAGWSAGGTLAFRASQLLCEAGEQVANLFLLDAPVPGRLGILPQRFFDSCQAHGFFGEESARPSWLFPHFKGVNLVLNKYDPVPFPFSSSSSSLTSTPRNVHLIWATKGSFQGAQFEKQAGDPADLDFLLEDRTDFTPGGWAKLFPGVGIHVGKAEGESHFTMLSGASAEKISNYIGLVTRASSGFRVNQSR